MLGVLQMRYDAASGKDHVKSMPYVTTLLPALGPACQ